MDELSIGKAGEYLVCFDLTVKGYNCFPSEQGLPFDVVLLKDNKLLKIQVKTCLKSKKRDKNNVCVFNIRHGRGGQRGVYSNNIIDILAFVNIETREIAYIPVKNTKSIIEIYPNFEKGKTISEVMENNMNLALTDFHNGTCVDVFELAKKYNISKHTLFKYKKLKQYTNKKKVSFFADFDIEGCI